MSTRKFTPTRHSETAQVSWATKNTTHPTFSIHCLVNGAETDCWGNSVGVSGSEPASDVVPPAELLVLSFYLLQIPASPVSRVCLQNGSATKLSPTFAYVRSTRSVTRSSKRFFGSKHKAALYDDEVRRSRPDANVHRPGRDPALQRSPLCPALYPPVSMDTAARPSRAPAQAAGQRQPAMPCRACSRQKPHVLNSRRLMLLCLKELVET